MTRSPMLEDRIQRIRAEINAIIDAKAEAVASESPGVPLKVIRNLLTARAPACPCAQYLEINRSMNRRTGSWRLSQRQLGRRLKLSDRLRCIGHLDGGHAHVTRRFEVDTEIVEINAASGVDAQRLDHHLIDARVGLSQTDLGEIR